MKAIKHTTPHTSRKLRNLSSVDTLLIHYTGSMSLEGTIEWFKDPSSNVSAHYVIGRGGEIHEFNGLRHRLWHAGKSSWGDRNDINSYSVGVELVGTYNSGFTDQQETSLVGIIMESVKHIDLRYILGHEQVSPGRKIDPGPLFDWDLLRFLAESNHYPYLERVGPYIIQPPSAGIIPITASPDKMESGSTKGDKTWSFAGRDWLGRMKG